MTTGPMAPHHRRAIVTTIVTTLVVLALATGSLVAVFYKHLDANLKTGQAIKHLAKKKHTGPKDPLNILVMGIDTRDCAGCHVDNEPGGDGSDTTILMHVSADRKTAYGISIPRDALVKPVPCTEHVLYKDTGLVQWNAAYAAGGADCTAEQLEKNFGIYVDDYVTVNFGGFKDMVNAIGGVDMCIPVELDDPKYEHVDFKPGASVHLSGDMALKYVRLRHVLDGTDIGRMKRQQAFISAMINKVISAGTLTRPDRVLEFANALTKSMTTSPDLGHVKDLVKLGNQLKHIDLSHIHFITVPNEIYDAPVGDPYYGRVKILPSAKKLWKRVNADEPLSKALAAGALSANSPPGSSTSPSTPSGTPSGSTSPTGPASTSGQPSGRPSNSQAAQDAAKVGLCA
jgi:LCP family protein required for cell wall assembly